MLNLKRKQIYLARRWPGMTRVASFDRLILAGISLRQREVVPTT
jgi:hypothetical protein